MWTFLKEPISPRVVRYSALRDGDATSVGGFVDALVEDSSLADVLSETLRTSSFDAFRWETPGVVRSTLSSPFEFVLVDAPTLERPPDRSAFAEHFDDAKPVVRFGNLRRDAVLVVPCPRERNDVYTHLAGFVRGAPHDQVSTLWSEVGRAMRERICERPVWLSTAGGGVAWLHVRLDDRPKYYAHAPYRSPPTT